MDGREAGLGGQGRDEERRSSERRGEEGGGGAGRGGPERGGAGRRGPYHGQVVVLGGRPQVQQLLLLCGHPHEHAVEDVVVPLLRGLVGKVLQRV